MGAYGEGMVFFDSISRKENDKKKGMTRRMNDIDQQKRMFEKKF